MKISEITTETIAEHLRVDETDDQMIQVIKDAAVEYVRSYTGLTKT